MTSQSHTPPQALQGAGLLRESDIIGNKRKGKPALVPVARSTLRVWINRGRFPAPIRLSERVIAFRIEDVTAWLAGKWIAPNPMQAAA